MTDPMIQPSSEVADALSEGRPLVALESTLIAHGLPAPTNLETALESEAAVRDQGAIPATIAVLDGEIRVGLERVDLERLATSNRVLKAGRRDLGAVVAGRKDAATTVSATLWIARKLGIAAMATGGLGGVHRGASSSFDVSTDLDELARGDGMVVVCAGAKTILDVAATLEHLETRGVLVVGYRTDALPGFTVRTTGLALDWRADSIDEAAAIVHAHRILQLPGAVVLAQEVAADVALEPTAFEAALSEALVEATSRNILGKPLTPFLLDAVRRATGGASLRANRALIVANAGLAGGVAAKLGAITA